MWKGRLEIKDGICVSLCLLEKMRISLKDYRARLTARLFFDNLLDQDQHLEWFLSSVEWASLDSLPIWLLMLDIYWDSLVRYRKRGRRLAELLLEKLRQGSVANLLSEVWPFN